MILKYTDAMKMIGTDYEDALDVMWDSNGFGEEVKLGDFLIAWTRYIEKNTEFAVKQGLI